jgi:hypothetical protein
LTIAKTSGLLSALNGKQNTINDGDLTIAKYLDYRQNYQHYQQTLQQLIKTTLFIILMNME